MKNYSKEHYSKERTEFLRKQLKEFFINEIEKVKTGKQSKLFSDVCLKKFSKEILVHIISTFVEQPWFISWVRNLFLNISNPRHRKALQFIFDKAMRSTEEDSQSLSDLIEEIKNIIYYEFYFNSNHPDCIKSFVTTAFCWEDSPEGSEFWIEKHYEWEEYVNIVSKFVDIYAKNK